MSFLFVNESTEFTGNILCARLYQGSPHIYYILYLMWALSRHTSPSNWERHRRVLVIVQVILITVSCRPFWRSCSCSCAVQCSAVDCSGWEGTVESLQSAPSLQQGVNSRASIFLSAAVNTVMTFTGHITETQKTKTRGKTKENELEWQLWYFPRPSQMWGSANGGQMYQDYWYWYTNIFTNVEAKILDWWRTATANINIKNFS